MFRILVAQVLLLAIGFCLPAMAEAPSSHLVKLHNRVFDVGVDEATLHRSAGFIPVTDIPWLRPIFDEDPLFKGVIFNIIRSPGKPIAAWSRTRPDPTFRYTTGIPPELRLPGYEVTANTPKRSLNTNYKFLPTKAGENYVFVCHLPKHGFESLGCGIASAYAPDELIYLDVYVYFPRPFLSRIASFRKLVTAAREIAYCLDVTDGPREFPRDATGRPIVKDCAPALVN